MARFASARKNFQIADQAMQLNELHAFRAVVKCLDDLCDVPPRSFSRTALQYRYEGAKAEWAKCLRNLDALS